MLGDRRQSHDRKEPNMGGGSFSQDTYSRVSHLRAALPVDQVFAQSVAQEIHPDLDPKGVAVRESCDSPEHPESNAVAIWFDQTGSMGRAPELFAKGKQSSIDTGMSLPSAGSSEEVIHVTAVTELDVHGDGKMLRPVTCRFCLGDSRRGGRPLASIEVVRKGAK